MSRELLFIPGYQDQVPDTYPQLVTRMGSEGFTVFPLAMDWGGQKNPNRWAKQIEEQIGEAEFDTVLGHSFGGATALILTDKLVSYGRSPNRLVLCSASPLFRDDRRIRTIKEWQKGKQLSFDEYPQASSGPLLDSISQNMGAENVSVMYGAEEQDSCPSIYLGATRWARRLGAEPIRVENARHDLNNPNYAAAIMDVLSR